MRTESTEALEPETPAPTSKRRRVAVACDACRTRKSRCDGTRPQCSLCRDLGFECIYTPPTTAANVIVQKDYLHGLEERVKRLEDVFSGVREEIDGISSKIGGFSGTGNPENSSTDAIYDSNTQLGGGDALGERQKGQVQAQVPDLTGTEDSVDGMGAVTLVEEEDSGFFGIYYRVFFCHIIFESNILIVSRSFFQHCIHETPFSCRRSTGVSSITWHR